MQKWAEPTQPGHAAKGGIAVAVSVVAWLALAAALACDDPSDRPAVSPVDAGARETKAAPVDHAGPGAWDAGNEPDADAGADTAWDAGGDAPLTPGCVESAGSAWADWPIPDPTGGAGTPRAQSYDVSRAGVVIDRITQLMWQRDVDPLTRTWGAAKQHCACLTLGGYDDWRMPSRIELVSIVDFTKNTPSIDSAAFPATPSEWFWTSTTLASDATFAWYIYFDNGFSKFIGAEEFPYRVRCVRSQPVAPPAARYQINTDTVLDRKTGLTWQRLVDPVGRPWQDATATCANLTLAGGNWRLPSMRELQSLVDETRFDPAIDPVAFPDTPGVEFWTSSPVSGAPGSAWRTSFANGYTYDATTSLEYLARCVKP
jgi:hypothetical protein